MSTTLNASYEILIHKRALVEEALVKLVKRAARKGLPGALTWTWGRAVTRPQEVFVADGRVPPTNVIRVLGGDTRGATYLVASTLVPLTIAGEMPRLRGWRFVATLQHLDGENIVRALPGESIPDTYRTRGPACEHCRSSRRRNDTYVLRHDDGRTIQVGRSCLGDFLGDDAILSLAARAELYGLARSICEEGAFGDDDGMASEVGLERYLAVVAWFVRTAGWVSRTVARDRGGSSTASDALACFTIRDAARKFGLDVSDADRELAASAEAWADGLSDDEVTESAGDYLHNLRAVARTGLVSSRTAGIAASAIVAYQRHIGAVRQREARQARPLATAHVGTVGERVSFGVPARLGKKGAPLKGQPTVLSAEPVTLDFVAGYETQFGYTTILKFRSAEGATLVWKASGASITRADVGKRFTLVGAVKAHDEYKGEAQTLLTRCTVAEVVAEVADAAAVA